MGADHRRRAGLPVQLRPGQHEQQHPAFIDCLDYVRKRCWDFLVRELMGTHAPACRPSPIAIDTELLGEMFA